MAPSLMRVSVLTPELLMPIHRALLTPDIIVREALLYLEDELSKVRHA
jgi:hypothetical protein